ncbi:acetylglutamate kinase [Brevibacillus dissolubilis]|uniref:acetylglutamate kinase n=1 Tax=Brevibacillus dissolubilis TaxID=1844116 RepID=UPI001115C416|nr:acetylglutamate kinase [Brevibacillus dissolubilis]
MEPILVIKCGGSTMEQLPVAFFTALAQMQQAGKQIVIVHGGGPAINQALAQMQIQPQFVDGMRVTDEQTLQVVEMVLCGSINKQLVRRIQTAGGRAWGLSGVDGGLITAQQTSLPLGLVGEIERVDPAAIHAVLDQGCIPVIAPLGVSADGTQAYNINADVAAGAVAAVLSAEKLLMITDVAGIMRPQANGELAVESQVSPSDIAEWTEAGIIYGGMIPKVQSALDALHQGVREVVICQGTAEAVRAACTGEPVGTSIQAEYGGVAQ